MKRLRFFLLLPAVFILFFTACDTPGLNGNGNVNPNDNDNQTPVAGDFIIGNLTQTVGDVTAVTITPKTGKSAGSRTIYYEGISPTTYTKSTTVPSAVGSYAVTFDVAEADGFNAATGLAAGTLIIKPVDTNPDSDTESVQQDKAALAIKVIPNYYRPASNNRLVWLPSVGAEGSAITWSANKPEYVITGGVLALPGNAAAEAGLTLTATIKKGAATDTKVFSDFTALPENQAYAGYLFAYFKGNATADQQVCYALSPNAKNWTALNFNNQVLNMTAPVTNSGAIRDPYILRGEDGIFYMTCTDMDANGGNFNYNPGIVLSKSPDLINWTHSAIRISQKYSQFSNINAAWAPQVFWDDTVNKYMVYFSTATQIGNNANDKIYYTYANSDFTDLENTVTQLLYVGNGSSSDSRTRNAAIDGDIVFSNGSYHLFYKTEGWRLDNDAGQYDHHIVKASSNSLTGPYYGYDNARKSSARTLENVSGSNQNQRNVEGSSAFRLIGTTTWNLIYDVYNQGARYDFAQSTNVNFTAQFTDISSQITRNFNPRHGCILPLTKEEYDRLSNHKWPGSILPEVTTDAPLKLHYTFDGGDTVGNGGIINKAPGYTGTNDGTIAGGSGSLTTTNDMPNFYTGTNTGTGTTNTPGYIDMGANASLLITAQDDYTIAAYIRLESASDPTNAGWFLWCMASVTNATQANGRYTFFKAYPPVNSSVRQTYSVTGWGAESSVSLGNLTRNRWIHVMYREVGDIGTVYIDGQPTAIRTHTIKNTSLPASGAAIQYNWLGRPCFASDQYMQRTRYADFRIYGGAISESQIAELNIPERLAQLNGGN